MTIDPRLADRRTAVAEDRARRNITRLLRLIGLVALAAAVTWLFLSPTLSVEVLELNGVQFSSAPAILDSERVEEGRPLILIRPGDVESALLEDPWIKTADVDLDWPKRVVVTVVERAPTAWVETAAGWARRAVDGVVLPGPAEPDGTLGVIAMPFLDDAVATQDETLRGALEFLDNLPSSLSAVARVEIRESELWAQVGGFDVRLGRPIEMAEKALTVATLLQEDLEPGSILNVIAPTNPAVSLPGTDEGEDPASEEQP